MSCGHQLDDVMMVSNDRVLWPSSQGYDLQNSVEWQVAPPMHSAQDIGAATAEEPVVRNSGGD